MTIEIKVPPLPESVTDATLVAWHKAVGEGVARRDARGVGWGGVFLGCFWSRSAHETRQHVNDGQILCHIIGICF